MPVYKLIRYTNNIRQGILNVNYPAYMPIQAVVSLGKSIAISIAANVLEILQYRTKPSSDLNAFRPSDLLDWFIIAWTNCYRTRRIKFQFNFNRNAPNSFREIAFQYVVCKMSAFFSGVCHGSISNCHAQSFCCHLFLSYSKELDLTNFMTTS